MLSLKLLSITHTSMPTGGPTLSLLFINSSHVLKLATRSSDAGYITFYKRKETLLYNVRRGGIPE